MQSRRTAVLIHARHSHHRQRRHGSRLVLRAFLALLLIGGTFEGYRAYTFVRDAMAARSSLLAARHDLDIGQLTGTEAQVNTARARVEDALAHTRSARQTLKYDPLIQTTARLPLIGTQVRGLQRVLEAAQGLEETGLIAA